MKRRIICFAFLSLLVLATLLSHLPNVVIAQGDDSTDTPTSEVRVALPTNTARPTRTAVLIITPSFTPSPVPTQTPLPPVIVARLCADCTRVRLRQTPGTAGVIVQILDNTTEFTIIGRTPDSQWIQISINANQVQGWVATRFAQVVANSQLVTADLIQAIPVAAVAVEASPTPTLAGGGIAAGISNIDVHTRQIFQKGQSLGNRPNFVSRVGDSITFSAYFLTPFGTGQYNLGSYGSLSGAIGYFNQGASFTTAPIAANGGWSTFDVLQKITGAAACSGQTYLVCEYTLHKPAVAVIMFGTNDSGSGTTDVFAGNLRQIVQTSIDRGIIPILSTIPPKDKGADQSLRVDQWNEVIRETAAQFDVPLMDYFSVMNVAPNHGLGPDGLHPSHAPDGSTGLLTPDGLQYGYNIRNLITLQALDAVWRYAMQ